MKKKRVTSKELGFLNGFAWGLFLMGVLVSPVSIINKLMAGISCLVISIWSHLLYGDRE